MKILMKFKKIFTKLYIFYFFKKTNRSLEKQLYLFDSFDFFDPKHNYAFAGNAIKIFLFNFKHKDLNKINEKNIFSQ